MFECPGCQHRQVRTEVHKGVVWVCEQCNGRVAAIATLRKVAADVRTIEEYWSMRRKPGVKLVRSCPGCIRRMKEVSLRAGMPVLDVCNRCQLFWFDPSEYEQIPKIVPPAHESKEARLRRVERAQAMLPIEVEQPSWQLLFCLFGWPVETAATRVRRYPKVTWWTAGVVCALSLVSFVDLRRAVDLLAFVPAEPWRLGGLTVLTAFVLHADIWHLLGNLYFLLVFGDNVEDFLGPKHFAALLLLATVGGSMVHTLLDPGSTAPCIGASGGISGVMAFYALRFPKARLLLIQVTRRRFPFPGVFYGSVWSFFLVWVVLQLVGFVLQARGLSAVSAAAHLGGASVGALYWAAEEARSRHSMEAGSSELLG